MPNICSDMTKPVEQDSADAREVAVVRSDI